MSRTALAAVNQTSTGAHAHRPIVVIWYATESTARNGRAPVRSKAKRPRSARRSTLPSKPSKR
ncbi:MAG TPA: hypothetical protein DDX19_17615 [Rhodopirellula baltica]|nr:hypothetical protein [Rhodopirellula baltica]